MGAPNIPQSGSSAPQSNNNPIYEKMPPPRETAYSSRPSIEGRMEKLGNAIKVQNDPEARKTAPSLIGRATSSVINFLSIPFVTVGRFLGLIPKEQKDDLSFQVDINEFEKHVNSLSNAATEAKNLTSNKRITDSEYKAVLEQVRNVADAADQQRVEINKLKNKNGNVGDLFEIDKAKLDQAVKDVRAAIDKGESKEQIKELLNNVNKARDRLNQTFEVEKKR